MFPTHPRRAVVLPLAALLVLGALAPAAAAAPDVRVTSTASPTSVTVGFVVAYPVTVTNMSGRTLNHVTLSGTTAPVGVAYLGSAPTGACSQTQATCDFGTLRAAEFRSVTFYYRAPASPGSFTFTATALVSEGDTDAAGSPNQDTFAANVVTNVLGVSQDLVRGHAFGTDRTFTTGLTTLGTGNPHGTTVRIPVATTEVTVADLLPTDPAVQCPPALTTCFGWGSSLNVGDGGTIAGGIEVTTRWDYSELPNGMTAKKLHVAHLLGGGLYEEVTGTCTFVAGVPTNMPCFSISPFGLPDKDIQATYWLASNRVTRGY
jgi:hypothetical protein